MTSNFSFIIVSFSLGFADLVYAWKVNKKDRLISRLRKRNAVTGSSGPSRILIPRNQTSAAYI